MAAVYVQLYIINKEIPLKKMACSRSYQAFRSLECKTLFKCWFEGVPPQSNEYLYTPLIRGKKSTSSDSSYLSDFNKILWFFLWVQALAENYNMLPYKVERMQNRLKPIWNKNG